MNILKVAVITLLFLLLPLLGQRVYAMEDVMATDSAQASTSASIVDSYPLPFPGLLPDSPLYFLKVFRDRIIDFAVSDPLKKEEFTLLQADKRLRASLMLVEKGKIDLAETTESKAGNYLERSVTLLQQAKKNGREISSYKKKLTSSLARHEVEVTTFIQNSTGKTKDGFTKTLQTIHQQQILLKQL